MRTKAYYQHSSNYTIATEILTDPNATPREQVLAGRIRGEHGERIDNRQYAEHKHD